MVSFEGDNNKLKMKSLRIILLLVFIVTVHSLLLDNAFCQDTINSPDLIPIYKVESCYYDTIENKLIIPKYNLKRDNNNILYFDDNIIFEPKEYFNHFYYEIFKEQYIIITLIYDTLSSLRLPIKNLIRIISLSDVNKIYEANLQGSFLKDINIEKQIVYVENIDYEIIEIYMKKLE